MAAKTEYVFFRMAAPVTSGLITGESVGLHTKAQPCHDVEHKQVMAQEKMAQAVTCHPVPQKK